MVGRWVWAVALVSVLILQIPSFGIMTNPFFSPKATAETSQRIYPIEDNVVVCGLNCKIERKANVPAHEEGFTYGLTPCQNTPYFLKFDVSDTANFPKEGFLRLTVIEEGHVTYDPAFVNFRVIQVSNAWNDATITFDTQPAELEDKRPIIVSNPGIALDSPYNVFIPVKDITVENGTFSLKVEDTLLSTCDDWVIIDTVDSSDIINRPYFEFSSADSLSSIASLTIVNFPLSPTFIKPGETFRIFYDINNPTTRSFDVWLGATIRHSSGFILETPLITDYPAEPGPTRHEKVIAIPKSAPTGSYDYQVSLWDAPDGNQFYKSSWATNAFTVETETSRPVFQEPAFDFSISPIDRELVVPVGRSADTLIFLGSISGTPQEVTLSCSGLPEEAGICVIHNKVLKPTTFTQLTISAERDSPLGVQTVEITGIGGGKTRSASIPVTISLKDLGNDFITKIFEIWLPAIVGAVISGIVGALFVRKRSRAKARMSKANYKH